MGMAAHIRVRGITIPCILPMYVGNSSRMQLFMSLFMNLGSGFFLIKFCTHYFSPLYVIS
ncbi:MAG: sortase B protein-sorting domain-containing protein [Dorea sp.]|nr:sortase B protein-sorting domain-containing protein [Dorea sp.]